MIPVLIRKKKKNPTFLKANRSVFNPHRQSYKSGYMYKDKNFGLLVYCTVEIVWGLTPEILIIHWWCHMVLRTVCPAFSAFMANTTGLGAGS